VIIFLHFIWGRGYFNTQNTPLVAAFVNRYRPEIPSTAQRLTYVDMQRAISKLSGPGCSEIVVHWGQPPYAAVAATNEVMIIFIRHKHYSSENDKCN